MTSPSKAAFIFSGNLSTGSATLTLTEEFTVTITANTSVRKIVFDNWVLSDGTQTVANYTGNQFLLFYAINGGPNQNIPGSFSFIDNHTAPVGGLSIGDGSISFNDFNVSFGDVVTIRPQTTGNFLITPGFNPLTEGTFAGTVFLADDSNTQISNSVVVPEPSSYILFSASLIGLIAIRRRQTNIPG